MTGSYTNRTLRGLLGLSAIWAVVAGPAGAETRFLNLGSSSSASSQYTYWVSVGQVIEEGSDGRLIPTVMESGASVDNLRMMKRGESELGLVTAEAAAQAAQGIGVFEGEEPMTDVRILWCYSALPNVNIVRADAGVKSLSDLDGKPYNYGIAGSSTEGQTKAIFDTLGIAPVQKSGSVGDAVDALRDGHVVGMTKGAASTKVVDSSFMQINASVPVNIVAPTDEEIEKVRAAYPYFSAIEVPGGVYPDHPEAFRTFVVAVCGATLEGLLSEEEAYQITKSVYELKGVQESAYPAAKDIDFAGLTAQVATVPLHPGALRYMREAGLPVPAADAESK
ncbi:MAG: TAXI family TRAP transporter solute-binding subunit [Rhodobacteraceae bacterium]|nr:TAXI family TRAP transporter solute-binding subunit [Paracoccaceae bacterium]MBR9823605.1 TAXI family TRAP transporter solute-binding subunit [Paracoccaceae bacterium]